MEENQIQAPESKGTMIGSIIVVIIIIIGAIYLFYTKAEAPTGPTDSTSEDNSAILDDSAGSDELADIESDLNVVDQSADPQLGAIESELE